MSLEGTAPPCNTEEFLSESIKMFLDDNFDLSWCWFLKVTLKRNILCICSVEQKEDFIVDFISEYCNSVKTICYKITEPVLFLMK